MTKNANEAKTCGRIRRVLLSRLLDFSLWPTPVYLTQTVFIWMWTKKAFLDNLPTWSCWRSYWMTLERKQLSLMTALRLELYEPTSTLSFWEDQQFKTKSPFPEHSDCYVIKLSKKCVAFLLTLLLELVQNNLNCSKMVWFYRRTKQLGFESWIWARAGTNGLVSGKLTCTSSKNLKT